MGGEKVLSIFHMRLTVGLRMQGRGNGERRGCPILIRPALWNILGMRGGMLGLVTMAALCGAMEGRGPGREFFREDFERGLREVWKPVEFEGETKHAIVKEGTNSFLQARAASSASGLAVKLGGLSAERATVSWKWKIDRIPAGGSDNEIKTFDHTARIFVAFKTLIGPPRTINYVWANTAKAGQTFHHPSSGRSRFIVLQSGNARAGEWIGESRDLARDWKQLFGDDEPPAIVGFGLMTDSDGTKTKVTGCYDDLTIGMR